MTPTPYAPRPGSTAYLTIEHLRAHGPTGELALAAAIDKEVGDLAGLLGWPISKGALRKEVQGDEWVYSLGDGVPVVAQAPAALFKKTPPKGDQPRSERGREGMEPKACESANGRGRDAAPALITLPHHASPVGGPLGAGQLAAASPIDAATAPPTLRIALWSDGELHIRRTCGAEICFNRGEARALVGYLDAIALDMLRGGAAA